MYIIPSEYIDTLNDGLAEAKRLLDAEREVSRNLAEAPEKLRNETSGFVGMARVEDHGHTNYSVIKLRIDEADAALARYIAEREGPKR